MSSDEYRELQLAAANALRDLLYETEPGTAFSLHTALAYLDRTIKAEWSVSSPPTPPERRHWREFSVGEREREILGVLSGEQLTIRGLTSLLADRHTDMVVLESTVRSIVKRLHDARELDREREPATNGRPQYRYFKRTALDGPIADLQRAFDAEES